MKYYIMSDPTQRGVYNIHTTEKPWMIMAVCYSPETAIQVCYALNALDKIGALVLLPDHLRGRGG